MNKWLSLEANSTWGLNQQVNEREMIWWVEKPKSFNKPKVPVLEVKRWFQFHFSDIDFISQKDFKWNRERELFLNVQMPYAYVNCPNISKLAKSACTFSLSVL